MKGDLGLRFSDLVSNAARILKTLGARNKLHINTSAVGNAGGGEDVLMTYTLPANTLAAGKPIKVTAFGTGANNANAKTVNLYFGTLNATGAISLLASVANVWKAEMIIIPTARNAQIVYADLFRLSALLAETGGKTFNTATETDTAGIVIKATATGVSDNDIICKALFVEALN
jgi:hypothetical protein